jgi:protein-S-isoprenylcysteine O-methyltransferase Ste14
MPVQNHILLVVLWILFGVLHSVLASVRFKQSMQAILKGKFKYYQLGYSIFAAVTLIGTLIFQLSIRSKLLFTPPLWLVVVMCIAATTGAVIMLLMIWKYFFYLSGISVFYKTQPSPTLQLGGLHRFVRHPLYTGTLLFIWALCFLFPYTKNFLACILITAYTLYGAQLEEKKLIEQFGEEYIKYRKRVSMLIPWLKK